MLLLSYYTLCLLIIFISYTFFYFLAKCIPFLYSFVSQIINLLQLKDMLEKVVIFPKHNSKAITLFEDLTKSKEESKAKFAKLTADIRAKIIQLMPNIN